MRSRFGLSPPEDVAERRQRGLGMVHRGQRADRDENVDDRLRHRAGNGGAAEMLDRQHLIAERNPDERRLRREQRRPARIVGNELDTIRQGRHS
jgi:hypothetical protein